MHHFFKKRERRGQGERKRKQLWSRAESRTGLAGGEDVAEQRGKRSWTQENVCGLSGDSTSTQHPSILPEPRCRGLMHMLMGTSVEPGVHGEAFQLGATRPPLPLCSWTCRGRERKTKPLDSFMSVCLLILCFFSQGDQSHRLKAVPLSWAVRAREWDPLPSAHGSPVGSSGLASLLSPSLQPCKGSTFCLEKPNPALVSVSSGVS